MAKMNESIGDYKSPDKNYGIDFVWEGEIRFGPAYYSIVLNGSPLVDKIFGFEFKWRSDSSFLALQQWLTVDYRKGPITALLLVDLKCGKMAQVSIAEKGFVNPLRFEGNLVIFEKEYYSSGLTKEYEIDLRTVDNWESIR
ncbi:hypothetical protein [Dysgonomonas massiliensis]|uniref:hypothetical protein n=1 Tax=Dysgonomonas massiliensis TaxID=2040292 RepID=UPI001C88D3EC|nr:hypothetical protein [Dysgonomonas massiliensis]